MSPRHRKIRVAIVLTIAIVAIFTAWRTNQAQHAEKKCVSGRHEEKDASGTVVRVTRTTCFS